MQVLKNSTIRNLAKVTGAGATVFAFALGMLVLSPEPEAPVAEAEADIFGFGFAEESQQLKFARSLKELGMETPRVYDHNGNTMYFSTMATPESPRQVMERFQREFVEQGLNERVHLSRPYAEPYHRDELMADPKLRAKLQKDVEDVQAYVNDMIGGMVPTVIQEDAWMMMGMTTDEASDNIDELVAEALAVKEAEGTYELDRSVRQMRYIDAARENGHTRVTAVWSGGDYEGKKIIDEGEDLNVNPDIPVCPGCSRLFHVEGKTEADYANHAFDGRHLSVDQVMSYYDQSLKGKGWQPSETAAVLQVMERQGYKERSDSRFMQYARGDEFLTVTAMPGPDGTIVNVAESN